MVWLTGIWLTTGGAVAAPEHQLAACKDQPAEDVIPWAIQRTVRIEHEGGSGTGVIVSPDGAILTASHVADRRDNVDILFADGTKHTAYLVADDRDSDLALLRVASVTDWDCLPIRSTAASVGSDLFVIGSPGGDLLSHSVSKGIVSSYRAVEEAQLIQTDAAINAGNSGGPAINDDGELIGIVSFKLVGTGVEGLGFAVSTMNIAERLAFELSETPTPFTPATPKKAEAILKSAPPKLEGPEPDLSRLSFGGYSCSKIRASETGRHEVVISSWLLQLTNSRAGHWGKMTLAANPKEAGMIAAGSEVVIELDTGMTVTLTNGADAESQNGMKVSGFTTPKNRIWQTSVELSVEAIRMLGLVEAKSIRFTAGGRPVVQKLTPKWSDLMRRTFACYGWQNKLNDDDDEEDEE